MDNADIASREQDRDISVALLHKRQELGHIGVCRNCNEQIGAGCFCDADCREDYERRERFRAVA